MQSRAPSDGAELDALRRITDRVAATPDDQLSSVLDKLLPKVLPLASNAALRDSVISLVSQVMRRAKPLRTALPCAALISQLIRIDQDPFVVNFAIAFVDVGLPQEVPDRKWGCADAVIQALQHLAADPFCSQMQALFAYTISLLDYIPDAFLRAGAPLAVSVLLEDWLLDIALAQPGMRMGAIGSILPGLSERRVGRLLGKRPDGWTPSELNALKLRVLRCIGQTEEGGVGNAPNCAITAKMRKEHRLVGIAHSVIISVVLMQQDTDSNVNTQATFKLNGCRTSLRDAILIRNESEIMSSFLLSAERALAVLLYMASTPHSDAADQFDPSRRTILRGEVRAALLRWVSKEAQEYLVENAMDCIRCLQSNFFAAPGDQSQSATRLKLASLMVLEKLIIALSTEALVKLGSEDITSPRNSSCLDCAGVLFESAMTALSSSMPVAVRNTSTAHVNSGLATENSDEVEIRRLVYNILDKLCRVFPDRAVREPEIVYALFRLLPVEDDVIMASLFCALGAVKAAYEHHKISVVEFSSDTGFSNVLESLIRRSRCSPSPKPRLVALTWCRSLFAWNIFVIETMFALLGDPSEVVATAVLEEFRKLEHFLSVEICVDLEKSEQILKSLVLLLPMQLAQVKKEITEQNVENRSLLAVYHCLSCITFGLKGLMGGSCPNDDLATSDSSFRSVSVERSHRLLIAEILDEYTVSFSSAVQWPTISSYISKTSVGWAKCIISVVSSISDVILFCSSSLFDVITIMESKWGKTYRASCESHAVNERAQPLLNELILHIMYQILLFRGGNGAHICEVMQALSPHLLAILHESVLKLDYDLPLSLSAECIARMLGLMCLLDVDTPAFDCGFIQATTRALRHKIASTTQNGCIRVDSHAAVLGCIRCSAAILEVIISNGWGSDEVKVPNSAEALAICASYCVDIIINAVECLEVSTGTSTERFDTKNRYRFIDPCVMQTVNSDAVDCFISTNHIVIAVLRLLSVAVMRGAIRYPAAVFEGSSLAAAQTSVLYCCPGIMDAFTDITALGIDERLLNILHKLLTTERNIFTRAKRKLEKLDLKTHALVYSSVFDVMGRLFWPNIDCSSIADPKKPHLWDDIVSYSSFSIADVHLRFSLAEFLTKLIYSYGSSLLDRLIEFAESIENLIMMAHSERETSEIDDRNVKGTIAIAILVYLKQTCDNSGNVRALCSISVAQLERLCIILLKLLGSLEKLSAVSDPLVQDACCSGLCFCYQLAGRLEFEISKTASVKANAPIQKLIANTVIYTLTRDKKLPQPPGMAPAGASGENRSDRDSDTSAANNLLQGASAETQDPLAAAAAEAAARIGLSAVDLNALRNAERNASVEQAMGGMRSDRVAASEGDFGVYTKACKVAKKSGDPSVVFSVLTLIRRNPAVIGSAILYDVYWPRLARIDPSKRQSLLPMLYVSKFDPSPPVKAVMKDLWNRLIPAGEMPGLLSTYAGSIIRYAISQTTSGAWRDRECGCLALESFIGNKSWNDIFPFLDDLWNSAMQVLDDIRESTRSAAIGFAKVLSQQIMRACSPDINPSLASSNGSNDSDEISSAAVNTRDKKRKRDDGIIADLKTTTAVVIPILLDKGLVAQSQEGRGFSLGLLVQVVKVSKQSLKEHLIRIIDILIESMAALEPRTLQYMQFHTARLNISDKDLEDLRLSLSQNSPMQEALDICLEALPANYLPSVIYQLGGHLRGGVGLATRVSAVKSLVRLMENSNPEFKKNDGALARIVFEACLSVLLQFDITSVGLKSSMLGCLSAAASCILGDYLSTQCVKLVERYSSQFSTSFEATETLVIAQCLGSIIRKAGEQLEHDSEVWSSILCCSYIGSFHPDIDVSKAWMITWNESLNCSGCGNKYSALLKVLPSVTIQICELLRSLSWVQRTVGLAVIRDVTNSLPFDIIKVYTFDLIVSLLSCIKFRIWTGQALVLETLAIILEKNKSMYSAESWDNNGVVKVPVGSVSDTNIATSNIDGSMKADDDSVTYQYVAFDSIVRIRHESEKTVEEMMFEINRCAVIDLFLAEAVRGDKLYRYSAAKALAEMHESWVYLSKYCPAIAMQYLSTLCMLSGIIIESVEPTMIKSFDDNEILAQDQKSILKSSIPPSSSNMFGDRYSKHLPAKAAVKLSVGAGRRRANRNTPAEIQDQTIANRTPERGMAHTLGSDYIDPAYRVKLMECIYYGWPMMISESMDVCSPAAAPTLSRSVVLKWVYIHSKVDNWSIKRQGILILSSIVCGWSGVSREDLVMAIKFVTESYATNSAHNQVREAALFCLRRIIENSTELSIQNCLKQELGHDIRLLLVQAQSDSAPGVLDELQRIRSIWKISS